MKRKFLWLIIRALLVIIVGMMVLGCGPSYFTRYEYEFHPDYRLGVYEYNYNEGYEDRYFFYEKCYVPQISGGCAVASGAMWLKYLEYLSNNSMVGKLWDTTIDIKDPYTIVFDWFNEELNNSLWDINNFTGISSGDFRDGMVVCLGDSDKLDIHIGVITTPIPLGEVDGSGNISYFSDGIVEYNLINDWAVQVVDGNWPVTLSFKRWDNFDDNYHMVIIHGIQTELEDTEYEKVYGVYVSNPNDNREMDRLLEVYQLELYQVFAFHKRW